MLVVKRRFEELAHFSTSASIETVFCRRLAKRSWALLGSNPTRNSLIRRRAESAWARRISGGSLSLSNPESCLKKSKSRRRRRLITGPTPVGHLFDQPESSLPSQSRQTPGHKARGAAMRCLLSVHGLPMACTVRASTQWSIRHLAGRFTQTQSTNRALQGGSRGGTGALHR